MRNIQIKRGSGKPSSLKVGEPAIDLTNKRLYIGTEDEIVSFENSDSLESLKYYGDKDIIPSDSSYFTVNETGKTITGLTEAGETQTELVIPYKINGKEITTLYSGVDSGIPESILNSSTTITKITIPKSVTTLGRGAFYNCTSLTSINIPDSVTSIGESAFSSCTSLTSINIPDSVTSIGESAFESCTGLASINIPNGVTTTGNYVFYGCTGLASVNIPNSITSIGNYAFYECTGLKSINIPNSVTGIGYSAFGGSTGLKSITIPNSVRSIDDSAFSNCTSLTSIIIPNSVISIENNAFEGCTDLTIYCEQGSYAETYANTNNISVKYTDISAIEFNNKADKATTLEGYGITDAIGRKGTGEGSEIFNDYEGNEASGYYSHAEGYKNTTGYRYFQILTKPPYNTSGMTSYDYTLDSVDGLEVGDELIIFAYIESSSYISGSQPLGTILAIDETNKIITTNMYLEKSISDTQKCYLMVPSKPTLGSISTLVDASHVEGILTKAILSSHAEGYSTVASGRYSHTEGYKTIASRSYAHAEGDRTVASGNISHAEGGQTTASGTYSHAEGYNTTASGQWSHAEGDRTVASGNISHAEGGRTTASGECSHAAGELTTASGEYAHSEGNNTIASGNYAYASGFNTTASGNYSHAEGQDTIVSGNYAYANGFRTNAIGDYSHAGGNNTIAGIKGFKITSGTKNADNTGTYVLDSVEGLAVGDYCTLVYFKSGTIYKNNNSYLNNIKTINTDTNTITTNYFRDLSTDYDNYVFVAKKPTIGTTLLSNTNHAEGTGTIATATNQYVIGQYNAIDTEFNKLFIVGKGKSDTNRGNAFYLTNDGYGYFNDVRSTNGGASLKLINEEYFGNKYIPWVDMSIFGENGDNIEFWNAEMQGNIISIAHNDNYNDGGYIQWYIMLNKDSFLDVSVDKPNNLIKMKFNTGWYEYYDNPIPANAAQRIIELVDSDNYNINYGLSYITDDGKTYGTEFIFNTDKYIATDLYITYEGSDIYLNIVTDLSAADETKITLPYFSASDSFIEFSPKCSVGDILYFDGEDYNPDFDGLFRFIRRKDPEITKFKGEVATFNDLPKRPKVGQMYVVEELMATSIDSVKITGAFNTIFTDTSTTDSNSNKLYTLNSSIVSNYSSYINNGTTYLYNEDGTIINTNGFNSTTGNNIVNLRNYSGTETDTITIYISKTLSTSGIQFGDGMVMWTGKRWHLV